MSKLYDVFLSHNSADKEQVEQLARQLQEQAGIKPFLDKWHLIPGEPWQEALEEALDASTTVAVFIGPKGISPWHNEEMRDALNTRVRQKEYRVIPVLLPGATMPERGEMPSFLSRLTWVDFRNGLDDPHTFHRLLSGIRGLAPGPDAGEAEVVKKDETPYRGLEKFRPEDAQWFFGRESETQQIIEKLRKSNFLAVLGASGSGKSSVVLAGLIPALQGGRLPGSEVWPILTLTPAEQPLEELALKLADLIPGDGPGTLLRDFEADERALYLAGRRVLKDKPEECRLVLVVDQFEEVFTLCRDEKVRARFFANLLYASSVERSRIMVVLTMRADFLTKCMAYPDLADRIASFQFIITPMVEDQIRAAIEQPAARAGLELEHGLVDVILKDVEDEPGGLPLLEHALYELWKRRDGRVLTLAVYHEIGGVTGALAQTADATYTSLDEAQKEIAKHILLELVQPGEGTEDTRRRAKRSELAAQPEEGEVFDQVLQHLADARLVTIDQERAAEGAQTIVNVVHEALIRNWPSLQAWINENREAILIHRRLRASAEEWESLKRDTGVLYRGARLAQSLEWSERHDWQLSQLEEEFLQASQQAIEAEERQREETRQRQLTVVRRFLVGLSLLLIVAVAAAGFAVQQTGIANKRANEISTSVADAKAFAQKAQNFALVANARQVLAEGDTSLAIALALEAMNFKPPLPEAREVLRSAVYAPGTIRVFKGHTATVISVAFSPDGRKALSGSGDGNVILWDIGSGKAVKTFNGKQPGVWSVAISPDGKLALSGAGGGGTIILWDVESGKQLNTFKGHTDSVWSVAFSPDGSQALSGAADQTVILWDIKTGQKLRTFAGHTGVVRSVAFSPDGQTAVSGADDGKAILWNLASGASIRDFTGYVGILSVSISPDGHKLLLGTLDTKAYLLNLDNGNILQTLEGHSGALNDVAFSPDGKQALSGGTDSRLILWDLDRGQAIHTFVGHKDIIWSVAFSPDGRTALSASGDRTLRLWDLYGGAQIRTFTGHTNWVWDVAISPDGRRALSASSDKKQILWDVDTGEALGKLEGDIGDLRCVAFSPDGRQALSGGKDQVLILWDLESKEIIRRFEGHTGTILDVAFSPDGKQALSASADKTLILWNLATGQPLRTFKGHTGEVTSVAISPDGRFALSGSADKTLILWNLDSGQQVRIFEGHSAQVRSVAFSPDGRQALSGSFDNTLMLWDVESGEHLRTFNGHVALIYGVAFSPDGASALSSGNDTDLFLWDVTTGALLQRYPGHKSAVFSVAFHPNKPLALSGSQDGIVRLWSLSQSQDEFIAWVFANRYVPELTCE